MSASWCSALLVWIVIAPLGCMEPDGTTARIDLVADTTQPGHFFDLPYPSDLRLDEAGHPLIAAWPNPDGLGLIAGLVKSAAGRRRWPVLAVGYIDFSAPLAPRALDEVIAADPSAPILLVDLSDAPPARGRLTPVWAQAAVKDPFLPPTALAIAARPGFVLEPDRKYAFVVRRALGDVTGAPLGVAPVLKALAHGEAPGGPLGEATRALYAPLWPILAELGVPADEVAAATVFTTGDTVAENFRLSEAVLAKEQVSITDLAIDPDDGASHPRYCELHGKVVFPQYQGGQPPFDTDGLLVLDASGAPVKQREESANVVLSLPKQAMPAGGYPLVLYFHGSGGDPNELADSGPVGPGQDESIGKGLGPAHVLAREGFAMAATALPIAPSRVPGATDYGYLNLNNFAATRDIFRQGVIEQRLFAAALGKLEIPPSVLASCQGPTLPAGATAFRFDVDHLYAQGQSMGGMYTNLVSAVEPRIKAAVPTGAGGYWGYFILETSFVPGAGALIASAFNVQAATFVHPLLALFELASEDSDPLASTPRLAYRPLPGHPSRSVYEPAGENDEYFPTVIYDAMALGYDHVQAGEPIWPSMQEALELDGRGGLVGYPVTQNRTAVGGQRFTGAVVQYRGDGVADPHQIYRQLDAVKFQYRCFLASALKTGIATILAPAPIDSDCP